MLHDDKERLSLKENASLSSKSLTVQLLELDSEYNLSLRKFTSGDKSLLALILSPSPKLPKEKPFQSSINVAKLDLNVRKYSKHDGKYLKNPDSDEPRLLRGKKGV